TLRRFARRNRRRRRGWRFCSATVESQSRSRSDRRRRRVWQAVTLVLFGLARDPITALAASLIAGASWIAVLASLNISAQLALPDWVRGRGLAMFVMAFYGGLTAGSAVWGQVAGTI